jgi:hypothetical protein
MPIKDKKVRGRSFQKRTRVGGCRFDKEASWYPEFEEIILRFTGDSEAVRDDEFDAAALVSKGFESYSKTEADDFMTEEEEQFMVVSEGLRGGGGRSMVTGY